MQLNEEYFVENRFLKKLFDLGYRIYRQNDYDPQVVQEIVSFDTDLNPSYGVNDKLRDSFKDIILEGVLESNIKLINPWIEEDQISEVIRKIKEPSSVGLVQRNREIHELITSGISVSENRKTGEKSPTVRFIDFENPVNNSFLAVSQFKISIPGTEKHIIPDIVIFVNGIPLVVVECKSPSITDPINEAFTQILRYSGIRNQNEGNEKLFCYNLLYILTSSLEAKYGTITSNFENLNEWLEAFPYGLDAQNNPLQKQEILIQGMLSKSNFLDIIHTYTIFRDSDTKTQKIVARYHQFRAVKKIVKKLRTGKNPFEKGGIIWHTQGSGKSLSMMFAVRELYHHQEEFGRFKIVFVTDRRDLESQLTKTSRSIGFTVKVADSIKNLKELLKTDTPELVMAMISKFQEIDLEKEFPVLNRSEEILVMVDEAHRTEYSLLGANLKTALPNAIRIAFTGTPIDKTEETFGDYIDKYTITQSVKDKVTIPIIYEGRVHKAEIIDEDAMNKRFEDVFRAFDSEDKKLIMGKYTWKAYLEHREIIADKAKDMIDHYVGHIFINGFKAQVVTASRLAASIYKTELEKALREKINLLKMCNPLNIDLEKLENLKIACIISGSLNDPPEMQQYADYGQHEKLISSFLKPLDNKEGNVGIIVVQSMLITGFDAPIEQAMYLDNVIKGHNLLQAIARVNRVYKNKEFGYIIDYVGVFTHLKEALSNYYEKDIEEIIGTFVDKEKSKKLLKDTYNELVKFFNKIGIKDFVKETENCMDLLLKDIERRKEFYLLINKLNNYMDAVLPDPFAIEFRTEVKAANFIKESLRNVLREGRSIREASNKIRSIVENYLESKGITQRLESVDLLDVNFLESLKSLPTNLTRAKRLTSTIEIFIKEHYPEDPELYEKFSKKLENILEKYKENWEQIENELLKLRQEIAQGRSAERNFELDIRKEMPIFGILKKEIASNKSYTELTIDEVEFLKNLTKELVEMINQHTKVVDFWESSAKQKDLRRDINLKLLSLQKDYSGKISEGSINYSPLMNRKNAIAQMIIETAYHIGYGRH